jgi:hypothetical protein
MIIQLVFFDLPKGTTREEVMAKYRQTMSSNRCQSRPRPNPAHDAGQGRVPGRHGKGP